MNNVWCEARDCGHNSTGRCTLLSIKLAYTERLWVCELYANHDDDKQHVIDLDDYPE